MLPRRSLPLAALVAALALTTAGCGGSADQAASPAPPSASSPSSTPDPQPSSASTTSSAAATPTKKPTAKPRPTARLKPTAKPEPTAEPKATAEPKPSSSTAGARCAVPSGLSAKQVVLVQSSGSRATVRACRRSGGHYVTELGPYSGHVGKNGVSSSKREGDLRTPAGVFPLRGGFGAAGDPGLRVGSWDRVDSRDVWVDDPGSALYNTQQRTPADGRWDSAEKLLNVPAYRYAQVIGYNEARTPGRGSAIFFHVDLGHGTAGCVSLPQSSLLRVMRWEQAGAVMAIR